MGEPIVPVAPLLKDAAGVDSASALGFLRAWDTVHPLLHKIAQDVGTSDSIALRDGRLLAPILYPGALFCAGANYWTIWKRWADIAKRTTDKAPAV